MPQGLQALSSSYTFVSVSTVVVVMIILGSILSVDDIFVPRTEGFVEAPKCQFSEIQNIKDILGFYELTIYRNISGW